MLFFKWNMFFTSFLPLWISIIVIDIWKIIELIISFFKERQNASFLASVKMVLPQAVLEFASIMILILCISVSIICILYEIHKQESSNNKEWGNILKASHNGRLPAEFLIAYVLPMIAFDFSRLDSIVLFLIYFLTLAFLCIRNDNVYTNIFLEIKGYKMYKCDIECPVANVKKVYYDCLVLSKNDLTQTIPRLLEYYDFDKSVFIDIGDRLK